MTRITLLALSMVLVVGNVLTVPEDVVFPQPLAVGEKAEQLVTIGNDTNRPVQFTAIDVEPKKRYPQLYAEGGTCVVGGGLEAGEKCTINVHFFARWSGPVKGTLTIRMLTGSLASPKTSADWVDVSGTVQ